MDRYLDQNNQKRLTITVVDKVSSYNSCSRTVVVAQLITQSIPILIDLGSNPVIDNFY